MRILLIDVNCKHSSTGKIVYDLYTALNNDGHMAAICYGRGPKVNEPNIYRFSSPAEVYFHALMTRMTGLTGCYSYFATRELIRFIEKFEPDVVHIHELHAYFVNIAPLINYLKTKNIKTVWTFHCEFMYTGKCGHAYDCERWKAGCGNCPNIKEYPRSLFFDFTKRMFYKKKSLFADFENLIIVTPSKWLADRVKSSFLSGKDIRVINNGINTEEIFHPRAFEHLKTKHGITNEKIVLAVAPDIMNEKKGGRYVIELAKKMKDKNIKFILIGVENLNEKFDENIIALGRITDQIELAEYYSMADVFVICSKGENFPTTCLEALACGTPVVGFDVGGTKETAPDGYGSFVPFFDIKALENIERQITEKTLFFKSKKECAAYGKEKYEMEKMTKKYLELYRLYE